MIWGVPVADVLRLMQAHLLLSACAVVAASLIGLPVAIWAEHNRRASGPLLGTISLAQTIPGLALLALFYPLLLLLAQATGWPLTQGWIVLSLALYGVTGLFWLPVVWIQLRIRNLARAAAAGNRPLPEEEKRLFRIWFACGFPAFAAVLAILWLMVTRPEISWIPG